jgi:hypothetical protein
VTEEKKREIVECMFKAWSEGDMPLYGGLCIQDVFDFVKQFGVDTSGCKDKVAKIEEGLAKLDARLDQLTDSVDLHHYLHSLTGLGLNSINRSSFF